MAGLVLLVIALGVGVESTTFVVAFPTDPLGPAGFPLLAAILLAVGGMALLLQGGMGEAEPEESSLPSGWPRGGRVVLACLVFLGYALLLPVLGFVPATALVFTFLARLFGGGLLPGALVGVAFSVTLFALFVWGLGLALPVWPLGVAP
ncbi:MAG: tripartite tricarboxylate transporter TctB family protein [Gemmatimonadales bacterium]|nr:MAG: tripartite tricarboxylate transporter TctB family protein [Gemmatimonadales bacterium]